ncbi:hypothetical protein NMG60_11029872 [Bertholletia excelsa]
MRETAKMNAMRSGVVVVGALAFGYLNFHLGFKPFLERAQQSLDNSTLPHPNAQISDDTQVKQD